MGGKSDAFELDVLAIATGQTPAFIAVSGNITPWLALFTGTLSGDTPGTEASGGGYARIDTTGKWAAPSDGQVSNNNELAFATFTGVVSSGAPFTHFGLFDAETDGNPLYYGELTDQTKTGSGGDTMTFAIGALVLTED